MDLDPQAPRAASRPTPAGRGAHTRVDTPAAPRHVRTPTLGERIRRSMMAPVKAAGLVSRTLAAGLAAPDAPALPDTPARVAASPSAGPAPETPQPVSTVQRRVRVSSETVAVEMNNLVGHIATWVPSGPGSGNTFERWVAAPSEGPPPPLDSPETTINCWEMVLYAAYRSKAVDWGWLHDLYNPEKVTPTWYDDIVARLTPEGTEVYNQFDSHAPAPQRGDVVFWNGCSHVGLALGTRDAAGRAQVLSFWPPPDFASFAGTTDRVKLTTIEELVDYMGMNHMGYPKVTFGKPAW